MTWKPWGVLPCSLDFCFSPQFGKGGGFLEKTQTTNHQFFLAIFNCLSWMCLPWTCLLCLKFWNSYIFKWNKPKRWVQNSQMSKWAKTANPTKHLFFYCESLVAFKNFKILSIIILTLLSFSPPLSLKREKLHFVKSDFPWDMWVSNENEGIVITYLLWKQYSSNSANKANFKYMETGSKRWNL